MSVMVRDIKFTVRPEFAESVHGRGEEAEKISVALEPFGLRFGPVDVFPIVRKGETTTHSPQQQLADEKRLYGVDEVSSHLADRVGEVLEGLESVESVRVSESHPEMVF